MAVRASGSSRFTRKRISKKDSKKVNTVRGFYRDIAEIEHALQAKVVGLHSKIKFRFPNVDEKGETVDKWYDTTRPHEDRRAAAARAGDQPSSSCNKLLDQARDLEDDRRYRPCGQRTR